jgi:hypothetical protein
MTDSRERILIILPLLMILECVSQFDLPSCSNAKRMYYDFFI